MLKCPFWREAFELMRAIYICLSLYVYHFGLVLRKEGCLRLEREGRAWGREVPRVQGIINRSIRCLARRGGFKHIRGLIYEEKRGVLNIFLGNAIRDVVQEKALDNHGCHILLWGRPKLSRAWKASLSVLYIHYSHIYGVPWHHLHFYGKV